MKPSDINNIKNAYARVLNEDTGAGADTQGSIVMGLNMPDNPQNQGSYAQEAKDMAKSQLMGIIKEVKDILNELNSKKLEPWMATKIATVSDRIHSVDEWLNAHGE